jgi:hypothetical protein
VISLTKKRRHWLRGLQGMRLLMQQRARGYPKPPTLLTLPMQWLCWGLGKQRRLTLARRAWSPACL